MTKILTIEDEEHIRELIRFNLESEGYGTVFAEDGKEGIEAVLEIKPDLILLDLMLPVMDGYEVIKKLRNLGNETPVIMLTAKKEEVDKILGLEFGADDYMTKPFSVRELKARIKAVLRRYDRTENINSADKITIQEITIDIPAHEVFISDKKIELSHKEFELLKVLAENRGIVVTRDQLLDKVWGYDFYGETRTVDVHIRYLRKKLGGDEDRYITTVRGVGYKMV